MTTIFMMFPPVVIGEAEDRPRTRPPSVFANEHSALAAAVQAHLAFHQQRFAPAEHAGEILSDQVRENEVAHANKVIRVAPHWRQRSGSSTAPADEQEQRRRPAMPAAAAHG
jgi:hypothetical protein